MTNIINNPRFAPQPAMPPTSTSEAPPPPSSPQANIATPLGSSPQATSPALPTSQERVAYSPPLSTSPPETDSLIAQRRTETGKTLHSGIVPKIVRDEREVIMEILNEKLPYMPRKEKDKAVEKILQQPVGAQRDAWLKVFLIKNKKYASR
ncbi:MAG: hypothetical protein ACTSRS_17860 [Candidatus Helarchaeota archaeon]